MRRFLATPSARLFFAGLAALLAGSGIAGLAAGDATTSWAILSAAAIVGVTLTFAAAGMMVRRGFRYAVPFFAVAAGIMYSVFLGLAMMVEYRPDLGGIAIFAALPLAAVAMWPWWNGRSGPQSPARSTPSGKVITSR